MLRIMLGIGSIFVDLCLISPSPEEAQRNAQVTRFSGYSSEGQFTSVASDELFISEDTVKGHVKSVLSKLGAIDMEALNIRLHRLGGIDASPSAERVDAADSCGYDAILLGYALCGGEQKACRQEAI